jgi:hypothetical protein
MTIPSKFGFNWATGSRQDGFYVNFPEFSEMPDINLKGNHPRIISAKFGW